MGLGYKSPADQLVQEFLHQNSVPQIIDIHNTAEV